MRNMRFMVAWLQGFWRICAGLAEKPALQGVAQASPKLRAWVVLLFLIGVAFSVSDCSANSNVYVSRFWHNHQPIYWPEWNSNGGQNERVQYAWDSIVLKSGQEYGTGQGHPDNNLVDIFGKSDRVNSYQSTPRDSLAMLDQNAGYAISYSGSLIENINSLGSNNQLGYSSGWWNGFREARNWRTPSGSRRMDMVGFTFHHSLAAVLPKSVLRKEIDTFKQVWWKAWGGNSDLSDHSKGFFPTEMAFSTEMIDILVDEGYQWVIVPSHHLSRTCPTYNDHADPEGSFQIKSSPPNRADQLGPSPTDGWWFAEPNPGNAAWNVSPFAYQLHKTKYVNPETGEEKSIIVVPSDDVLSYKAGYSGAEVGMISDNISPYANDPNRPVIVLPATDGDNAWGGGSSSWFESTPSFFSGCQNAGYHVCAIQDFVNKYGAAADTIHVEPGGWIFPESGYGSPYFLKWVEPPVDPDHPELCYTNTIVNIETPGFALKFWSWAVVITGANWVETAEQIWKGEGGSVDAWKIASPYDNLVNGAWTDPNIVEQAWHIYLAGLDSGFNYYGGLGNDDEVKPSLATRRAIEKIESYVNARLASDATAPSIFRPQRFPWNPGGYTFGWFNSVPGADENYLKKMPSYFYVWTHVYDVSGVTSVNLKVRLDKDGYNSMQSNDNELYAGGSDVEDWVTIPMTMKALPNDRASLNAAADNGEIDYFITPPYLADYYFAKIDSSSMPGYKGKLLDYYIEATDSKGNVRKSDIQHVYVEDDGIADGASVNFSDDPNDCDPITVTYTEGGGVLAGEDPISMELSLDGGSNWVEYIMTNTSADIWEYGFTATNNSPSATVWFHNTGSTKIDSRGGLNWSTEIRDCDAPTGSGSVTFSNAPVSDPVIITYHPNAGVIKDASQIFAHIGFNGWETVLDDVSMSRIDDNNWQYSIVPIEDSTNLNVVFNNGKSIWDNHSGSNWNFVVTGAEKEVVAPGLIITSPEGEYFRFTNSVRSITLQGTAGDAVVGDISWTNVQAGAGGTIGKTSHWEIAALPLVFGSNTVTVSGSSTGSPTTNATDDASQSAYNDGWISGDDGGIGWGGGWNLIGGDNAGLFIATAGANSNLNSGSEAFGMYANSGDMAQAIRPFVTPLKTGQTVRVMLENGDISTSNSVGFALENDSGESLFECYFFGGEDTYRVTDSLGNRDTGVAFTDQGLVIEFTLTGATNYAATVGGTNISGNLIGRSDASITRLRFWNYSAGAGENHNAYFNDLVVTEDTGGGVLQDSSQIYLVDPDNNIPDWWLVKHFGSATVDVAQVDSDGDGLINQYEYWLGTDPTNAASSLVIKDVALGNSGDFIIDWLSVGAHSYDIQYSDDPLTNPVFKTLITIQESAVADGIETNRIFADTISPVNTNGARFYRVRLHR